MTPEIRFWTKIEKTEGCWLWNGQLDKDGYGKLKWFGRTIRTHRLAYQLTCDEIPDGVWVLHKCDNRRCCNPEHLYLGTNIENVRDRVERGRQHDQRGEKNPYVKLKVEQVLAIRSDRRCEREIGESYGISPALAGLIKRRQRWSWL